MKITTKMLPAAMGSEDSAVDFRREPCCGGFWSWKKSSSGTIWASLTTNCRPAGGKGGWLEGQLRAPGRLKPQAGLQIHWWVTHNHKARRNYGECKVSDNKHGQSASYKRVLSKVPLPAGSSGFRISFLPYKWGQAPKAISRSVLTSVFQKHPTNWSCFS